MNDRVSSARGVSANVFGPRFSRNTIPKHVILDGAGGAVLSTTEGKDPWQKTSIFSKRIQHASLKPTHGEPLELPFPDNWITSLNSWQRIGEVDFTSNHGGICERTIDQFCEILF